MDSRNEGQRDMRHILPLELVQEILSYLDYPDLANLALTSRSFNHFLGDLSDIKKAFMLQELDIRTKQAREEYKQQPNRKYPSNFCFWRICPKCNRLLHYLKFPDGAKRLGCLKCYARFAIKNPQQRVRLKRSGYMTAWAACCENWCLEDESVGLIIHSERITEESLGRKAPRRNTEGYIFDYVHDIIWDGTYYRDIVWRWQYISRLRGEVRKEWIPMPKEIAHRELCRRKFIDRNCQCWGPDTIQRGYPSCSPSDWSFETLTETIESIPICSRGYRYCQFTGCHFHCLAVDGCKIIDNSQQHHFHCLEPNCNGVLNGEIILNGTTPQNCDLECDGTSKRHVDNGDRWEKLRKILLSPESRCIYQPRQMAITPGQSLTISSMRSEVLQHPPSLRWIKDLAERMEKK